jgi:serine/threonine protein kinase
MPGCVKYLHDKNIAHGDIKPENIVVSGDFKTIKLIDMNRCIGIENCFSMDIAKDNIHRERGSMDIAKDNIHRERGSKDITVTSHNIEDTKTEENSLRTKSEDTADEIQSIKNSSRTSSESTDNYSEDNQIGYPEFGYPYCVGTKNYASPEIIALHVNNDTKITRNDAMILYKAADIYSLGKTFVKLLNLAIDVGERDSCTYFNLLKIIFVVMLNDNYKKRSSIDECLHLFNNPLLESSAFTLDY